MRRIIFLMSLSVLFVFRRDLTVSGESPVKCRLQGNPQPPVLSMDGDYVIGGIFSIHNYMRTMGHSYAIMPDPLQCTGSMDARELRFARAMEYAIHEINNSSNLLPGIRLGYRIHDSCASVAMAVKVAFQFANGQDPVFNGTDSCAQSDAVVAIVGESGSTPSMSMSRVLGPFGIPQVSHFATCACLSNKQHYPGFFRTIPSDHYQAAALARLVKYFGWTWIGVVRSDSDYGNNAMASFVRAAQEEGICIEYSEAFYRTQSRSKLERVASVIRRSTARVVLAFLAPGDMRMILEELGRQTPPQLQWIGSEAWVTEPGMLRYDFCEGAVGFGIQQSVIPGFRDFLLDLSPERVTESAVLTEFWESAFGCRIVRDRVDSSQSIPLCDGSEDVRSLQNPYTDTSQLRISNMVYKATYAIAHAIHGLACADAKCKKITVEPYQVLEQLKKVHFKRNGYKVSFDAYGDPVAKYELVNWQKKNGVMEFVSVGHYDASQPRGQEFSISKTISWVGGQTEVPVSVCSESCPPGTRKAVQKGRPVCCYDCIPCAEGEISNETDALGCVSCTPESWPNAQRDLCKPKLLEFLSWDEVLGIVLTVCSVSGACMVVIVAVVFYRHRTTPVIKANNSELSFLLLFSLTLCFLCSLTFIGRPSEWSCMLRHTAFSITLVLCISCVLGKTIVVLMAFRATLPGNNVMKWFGPLQQRITVIFFTSVQALICTLWLVLSPPFPIKNVSQFKEKIILECNLGSAGAFWAVLSYIGFLAVLCFVLAFLARKLPDNFNEAKFITFSMLIFCAVWITFIPAYVSSPGKFTVAVEIFAILASSFGLIFCIFIPKFFIIVCRPEQNTKKHLMGKVPSKAL